MATDTTTTNFSDHDLSLIDNKAHYRKANLSYHRCTNTNFSGLDLTGANFTGADCTGAIFEGAKLDQANFTAATVTRGQLEQAASTEGMLFEDAPVPVDAQQRIKDLEAQLAALQQKQKETADAAAAEALQQNGPVVLEEKPRKK